MMTAKECRAKAVEALACAAEATDPTERAIHNGHAREWTALALVAEVHSQIESELIARNDESDGA